MLDVLGDVIPFGIGVALSPFPIIAVLLLLTAPVGIRGGWLFLLGRAAGFAALTTLFAVLSELIDTAADSTLPAAILRIVLGAALIAFAVRKFVRRPRGDDEAKLPGWMQSIEDMSGAASLRLGVVLTVANPKEIAFAAGAGLTIGGAFLPATQLVALGGVFVLLACPERRHTGARSHARGRARDARAACRAHLAGAQQRDPHGGRAAGHRRDAARQRDLRSDRLTATRSSCYQDALVAVSKSRSDCSAYAVHHVTTASAAASEVPTYPST